MELWHVAVLFSLFFSHLIVGFAAVLWTVAESDFSLSPQLLLNSSSRHRSFVQLLCNRQVFYIILEQCCPPLKPIHLELAQIKHSSLVMTFCVFLINPSVRSDQYILSLFFVLVLTLAFPSAPSAAGFTSSYSLWKISAQWCFKSSFAFSPCLTAEIRSFSLWGSRPRSIPDYNCLN